MPGSKDYNLGSISAENRHLAACFIDYNQKDYINQCSWNLGYYNFCCIYYCNEVLVASSTSILAACRSKTEDCSSCLAICLVIYFNFHMEHRINQYGNYLIDCPWKDYD